MEHIVGFVVLLVPVLLIIGVSFVAAGYAYSIAVTLRKRFKPGDTQPNPRRDIAGG